MKFDDFTFQRKFAIIPRRSIISDELIWFKWFFEIELFTIDMFNEPIFWREAYTIEEYIIKKLKGDNELSKRIYDSR